MLNKENQIRDAAQTIEEPYGLGAKSAAQLLGISLSTFYMMDKTHQLGPSRVKLRRAVRWRKTELIAWMDAGCPARAKWQAMKGGRR